MILITEECVNCGACIPLCPENAIEEKDIHEIDQDLCTQCESCLEECPVGAIIQE